MTMPRARRSVTVAAVLALVVGLVTTLAGPAHASDGVTATFGQPYCDNSVPTVDVDVTNSADLPVQVNFVVAGGIAQSLLMSALGEPGAVMNDMPVVLDAAVPGAETTVSVRAFNTSYGGTLFNTEVGSITLTVPSCEAGPGDVIFTFGSPTCTGSSPTILVSAANQSEFVAPVSIDFGEGGVNFDLEPDGQAGSSYLATRVIDAAPGATFTISAYVNEILAYTDELPLPDCETTPPPVVGKAYLTGAAKVGSTLTCNIDYSGAVARQWMRLMPDVSNSMVIAGATAKTYRLTAADYGARVLCSILILPGGADKPAGPSALVAAGPAIAPAVAPALAGKARVGKKLSVSPGAWVPPSSPALTVRPGAVSTKVVVTYQWLSDGKVIKGATGSTYKLRKSAKGHRFSVRVTAKRYGYTKGVFTTKKTAKVKRAL